MPVPLFLIVTVKPIGSPALTGEASATLRAWTSGQRMSTDAPSESPPSLLVVTMAVLLTVPQSAASVTPSMWTVKLAPPARVSLVQVRTSAPTGPLIEQPATSGLIDQSMPAGRSSVTDDVIGDAIAVVADDDVEADRVARVDRSDRVGGLLDVDDGAQDVDVTRVRVGAGGSRPARWWRRRSPMFGMTAQFPPVVGALSVMVRVSSSASVPKLHERTSGLGTVLMEQSSASAPPSVQV